MDLVRDLSSAQIAFQVAGGDVDQFPVIRFRGTEGLCQLYRFEIELVNADDRIGFSSTLFIFYRNGCAERDARRFRRNDYLDRRQNFFQFANALVGRVRHAKFIQFIV